MARYSIGADLGSQHDYTALVVGEVERESDTGEITIIVRHMERYRNKLYPEVASSIRALTLTGPLYKNNILVIDKTGVGPAVTDIYRYQGIPHKPVIIHGGERESFDQDSWTYRVPKLDLIQGLLLLFHKRRFHVAKGLQFREILADELQNFRREVNDATGYQRFSHREGEHDDLVLAAALCVWGAKRFGGATSADLTSSTGAFDFSGDSLPFGGVTEGPLSLDA